MLWQSFFLFAFYLTQIWAKHHICFLGLSGQDSNTISISRSMIRSISKIDPYTSFTVLTRNIERAKLSYQTLDRVSISQGSMLNLSNIQTACSSADTAIFTAPILSSNYTRLDIVKIILNGLELAGVKYFIYCPGSLNIPNSYHNTQELYQFLHQQVMNSRFQDYSIIATGGWMELYFSYNTITILNYLPIFFGISFSKPHQYTSMSDIGPVTALVLYKIIYPGQYHISTHHREFEIYDPQSYSSSKLTLLLSSICQKRIYNVGVLIPYLLSTLTPFFQLIHHDRLIYLSSLFNHYLSSQYTTSSSKGYVNTVGILGYTPTTVESYFKEILWGEERKTKISDIQAKANLIRNEEMNEGMKRKLKKKEGKSEL